jgi:HKD family nuclease
MVHAEFAVVCMMYLHKIIGKNYSNRSLITALKLTVKYTNIERPPYCHLILYKEIHLKSYIFFENLILNAARIALITDVRTSAMLVILMMEGSLKKDEHVWWLRVA